jgi:predicted GIY-YIG superfamily endonuclease
MTSDLVRRVTEHKNRVGSAFARNRHVTKLVYYEQADTAIVAIVPGDFSRSLPLRLR